MNYTSVTKTNNVVTFTGTNYDGTTTKITETVAVLQGATLSVVGGSVVITYYKDDSKLTIPLIAANVTAPSNTGTADLLSQLNTMFLIGQAGAIADVIAGTPVKGVKAVGTYTIAGGGSVIQDGNTITLDTITYTFKTTLGTTAHNVLIGANDTAALLNLAHAITYDGGAGTNAGVKYVGSAAHPTVSATSTATTLVATALLAGVAGNSIACTEVSSGAWDAATLGTTTAGVDSTVMKANQIYVDTNYLYFAPADTTITSTSGIYKVSAAGL